MPRIRSKTIAAFVTLALLAPAFLSFLALAGPGAITGEAILQERTVPPASPGWINVTSQPSPPAMAGAMSAYDSRADVFVLFGGWTGEGLDGTWTFDPRTQAWTELTTNGSPSTRGDGNFVYDSQADAFILFGGWHETVSETYLRLGDTWIFYMDNRTWVQRFPVAAPSPRSDAAIAYDPVADGVLLFGGFDGSAYLGDLWTYSFASNRWTPRTPSILPSPRADGRIVYVPSKDRLFLFGGNDYSGPNLTFHHLADTWIYDWGAELWSQILTATAPPARDYPVSAFDSATDEVLLAGGYGNWTILSDLWAFDLRTGTWRELNASPNPPPRFAAVGGYSPQEDVFMIFSGLGNAGLLADTWFYTATYNPPGQTQFGLPQAALGFTGIAVLAILIIFVRVWTGSRRKKSRGTTSVIPSQENQPPEREGRKGGSP